MGHKRFSLEGAETLIPMLDALLHEAAGAGVEEALIGMAHRGRLKVLTSILGVSYGQIFRGFEGEMDPASSYGSGDVKYHLGAKGAYRSPDGKEVRMTVASNPSHLEAVDPVVEGMVRARQDGLGDLARARVLAILIHGDAAFSGQGVVAETLNLSQLKGYRTGGTVHIVINNQIGFTTGPVDLRSSTYAPTSRGVQADLPRERRPSGRGAGDPPLAFAPRSRGTWWVSSATAAGVTTRRTTLVRIRCSTRGSGHRLRKLYTEQLLRRGDLTVEAAEEALLDFRSRLERAHEEVREALKSSSPVVPPRDTEAERGVVASAAAPSGPPRELLTRVLDGLDRIPPGFAPHPKLRAQLARRRERFESGRIDWSLAETLALGSTHPGARACASPGTAAAARSAGTPSSTIIGPGALLSTGPGPSGRQPALRVRGPRLRYGYSVACPVGH